MKFFKSLYIALLFAFITFSCHKDDHNSAPDPNKKGGIVLEFDNVVGNSKLQLNTGSYKNASGETFTVSMLKYYVSNLELKTESGTTYKVPTNESYFLIKHDDPTTYKVNLKNVPEGNYTEMTFVIGVDSLRNTMDLSQRTGVLDPTTEGMYWSWNSGYIFVKMEGSSPQITPNAAGETKYRYHIGGFGGYNSKTLNNVKKITLPFGKDAAKVRATATPDVHLLVDVLKMFEGKGGQVSLAKDPTVMFSPYSTTVANNYVDMFKVDHVHNSEGH